MYGPHIYTHTRMHTHTRTHTYTHTHIHTYIYAYPYTHLRRRHACPTSQQETRDNPTWTDEAQKDHTGEEFLGAGRKMLAAHLLDVLQELFHRHRKIGSGGEDTSEDNIAEGARAIDSIALLRGGESREVGREENTVSMQLLESASQRHLQIGTTRYTAELTEQRAGSGLATEEQRVRRDALQLVAHRLLSEIQQEVVCIVEVHRRRKQSIQRR
jgi:hypothetical protein